METSELIADSEIVEQHEEQSQNRNRMVSTSEGNAVVSLPVGSLIAGASFNVITQDQLPHFKQMLCVDNNGFISGSTVVGDVGDLKATHIVIQPSNHQETISNNTQNNNNNNMKYENSVQSTQNPLSWSDAANLELFPIRCKSTTAELYKSKLGSGGRGRCIKYKDQWFTPSEFESLCGRGSSKDWKRSIRYGGRSLQALIDEGYLTPHATSCTCTACCDDDSTASGPVRLFTPYKRRRRNQGENDIDPKKKNKRNEIPIKSEDILVQESNMVSKVDGWASLSDGLDGSSEFLDPSPQSPIFENNQMIKRLEATYSTIVKATSDFKRYYQELKDTFIRKIEQLQRERDEALIAARVNADVDETGIANQLSGNEIVTTKKCANCNREALAECSLCRRTPYCSTFCQRKDWNAHQVECTRDPTETTQQIMLLVDDQT